MQHDEDSVMTKKPAPKKPAAKMPTIPRKKSRAPTVADIMQELDATLPDLSAEAPAKEDDAETAARKSYNKTTFSDALGFRIVTANFDTLDAAARLDAARLIGACCASLRGLSSPDIKKSLTGFSQGYHVSLNLIRTAIEESDELNDIDRAALLGAFEMATAFLAKEEQPGAEARDSAREDKITFAEFKHLDLHVRIDATSLFHLCYYVVNTDDLNHAEVKKTLLDLYHDYGEWLDPVRKIIMTAHVHGGDDEDEEKENEQFYTEIRGAFKMATAFLYAIRPPKDGA
jgi:hypothetical protein